MKKESKVSMIVSRQWRGNNAPWISGVTIESVSSSPTEANPYRKVVRVRWNDGSESIENVEDLYLVY